MKLSATFFFAASAGLMVLSQAREIVATYGGAATLAVAATTGITAAIALARISGGWLVDRFAVPQVMCAAHALALGGGVLLTLFPAPATAVLGLGMIGMGYGFISGATAGGIAIGTILSRHVAPGIARTAMLAIAWAGATVVLVRGILALLS